MNKKTKGLTLVEVMVALAVFTIVFLGFTASYVLITKLGLKHEEFVYFEQVCKDIDAYSYQYKDADTAWDANYFGDDYIHLVDGKYVVNYNDRFEKVKEENRYKIEYYYDDQGQLIVSVYNVEMEYTVIENLNYGASRYENQTS